MRCDDGFHKTKLDPFAWNYSNWLHCRLLPFQFFPSLPFIKDCTSLFWRWSRTWYHAGSQQQIRLRLYRPWAIKSDLAWATCQSLDQGRERPLDEKNRVAAAPSGEQVVDYFHRWFLKSDAWVGGSGEPKSLLISLTDLWLFSESFL